jgi:large subunit ribosomal protein L3
MLNTLLGIKGKMSQTYVEGTRVAVTKLTVGPCIVTQVKTVEKDGYNALQLGFGLRKPKNVPKPLRGHLQKVPQGETIKYLKEVRLDKKVNLGVGDKISISDIFKRGDRVTVTGTSKGKGFAGVVKRWGFAGGPKTHGQSDRLRAPGSIGQGTTPGRVYKGKKMAGRMGSKTVTVKNLIVVDVDEKKNELLLSGPVPGVSGGLLILTKTGSGKLSELVEETPVVQVEQAEEETTSGEHESQKEGSPSEKGSE